MTGCPPRWSTPRTRRKTLGPSVTATAKQLGIGLLPWQRDVLAVAMEQARGRAAYRDVLVSVPRQQGKSTLVLARIAWQMDQRPGSNVLYSAQNRVAARAKMLNSWWPKLSASPIGPDLKLFRGFGNETIEHANGSLLQLLSATESGGHGETADLVVIDEAWVHADARVEQAVRPAMLTRPYAQLWAVSTAGNSRSAWWKAKLESAISAVEMHADSTTCLFDWSAPPEQNTADEDGWWRVMPALGRTIDVATVRADLQAMGPDEFRRACLNAWPSVLAGAYEVFTQDQVDAMFGRDQQ
jgi:phage terminase large subunit-like protein